MVAGALANALPNVSRFAMQYLPQIIGLSAAYRPLMEGRPLDALVSGGLGFYGGKGIRGPVTGLVQRGVAQGPRIAQAIGQPQLAGAVQKGLSYALPAGVVALAPTAANIMAPGANQVQKAVGGAAQVGAGTLGYGGTPGQPGYGGAALPPGMGMYGPTSPLGSPLDVLFGSGLGQRLQSRKDTETQRDNFRILMPELEALREATAKKDFERGMAAAGIRQNIATRAAMQQRAQQAGLQAGLTAMQQAGQNLGRVYQYQ